MPQKRKASSKPVKGRPFATINDATDPGVDTPYSNDSDGVWIQNQLTATLRYAGTLTDISDFKVLFGTDGVAIPEPGTAVLVAIGLAALARGAGRRRERR